MAENGKPTTTTKDRVGYFRLDEQLFEQLAALAEKDERPMSFLVRLAVEQYLRRRASAA